MPKSRQQPPSPTPPDPTGAKPPEWATWHWIVYQELAGGATYVAAAASATLAKGDRVSVGSVSWLLRKWRRWWDPALFADSRKANEERRPGPGTEKRTGPPPAWAESRVSLADEQGDLSRQALALCGQAIGEFSKLIEAGTHQVTSRDIRWLAEAADKLSQGADRLAGFPDPNRSLQFNQQNNHFGPGGAPVPKGVVAALEGTASRPESTRDTFAAAKQSLEGIRKLRAGPDSGDDPIEVDGRESE